MDKYVHERLVNWVGVTPKDCYYESLSPNVGGIYKYTWQNISKFNSMYCYIMVFKKQVDWDMNIKLVAKTTGPLGKTVQCVISMCISRSFFLTIFILRIVSQGRESWLCLTTSLNVQGQFTYSSCGFKKEFKSIRVWNISKSPIHKSTLSSQTWRSVDTTVEKP